ncbi:MAG TPA: hypothetical protein DCG68_03295, partial [Cryomorphaceae bacterium]|nr:hypothetical protein [Cryomorphaceae bacterium]
MRRVKLTSASAAKSISGGFKVIGGSVATVAKSMAKFATIAGSITFAAAIAGSAKLLQSSVNIAAQYEGIQVKMAAFVGGSARANKILGEIAKFSTVTPFETVGLQEATNQMLGAGIAAEDVVDVLKEMAAVAKDTTQVSELADALSKGFAKGKFQTEELNKFLERGINLMPALSRVTGQTGAELQKAIQKGLKFEDVREAIASMSREGGMFFGMLEKQSGTFTGLISTLSSNWDEFRTQLGKPINDALKPLLETGILKIQELTKGAAEIGAVIGGAIGQITTAFSTGNWESVLEVINSGLALSGEKFSNIMEAGLLSAADAFGGKITEQMEELARRMDFLNLYHDKKEQEDGMDMMRGAGFFGGTSFNDDSSILGKPGVNTKNGPGGKQVSEAELRWRKAISDFIQPGSPTPTPTPSQKPGGTGPSFDALMGKDLFDAAFKSDLFAKYEEAGPPGHLKNSPGAMPLIPV